MFGELRQLLSGAWSWHVWDALCALLDVIGDPTSPHYEPGALDYADRALARWRDEQRYLYTNTLTDDRLPAHLVLVRSAGWYEADDVEQNRRVWSALPQITCFQTDCVAKVLDEPALAPRLSGLRDLLVYESPMSEVLWLLERHRPQLEELHLSWMLVTGEHMRRLLELPIEGLRIIELDVSFPDDDEEAVEDDDLINAETDGWRDEEGGAPLEAVYELGRCERLISLESLNVGGGHEGLDLVELVDKWEARVPSSLKLSLCTLPSGSLQALGAWGERLEELGLGHVGYDDGELWELLHGDTWLPRLRSLGLSGMRSQAHYLLSALEGRRLRELDLTFALLNKDIEMPLLVRAAYRETMEELRLGAASMDDACFDVLCSAPWPALRDLSLWQNSCGPDGATALARVGMLDALASLYMPENRLGDAGLANLSRGLPALHTLRVAKNHITDAGVAALAASPMAARLTTLDLCGNAGITTASLPALLSPTTFPALLSLDISSTPIVDDLASAAPLAALRDARPWVRVRM